jgi:DNA-binding transcriptional LysR family regulator
MLSLRALQCLIVLAEESNFSRAAARLHIAQPALSQQIRALEARIGTTLVDRSRRPPRLTEAGQFLCAEGQRILSVADQASRGALQIGKGAHGWLSIGFTRSSMYSILPPALKAFHRDYPQVELKLLEMLTDEQGAALDDYRIHVGIGREPETSPGCGMHTLLDEAMVVLLARDDPLAKLKRVTLASLRDTPLILYPTHRNARFRQLVINMFGEAGVFPHIAHETHEIQTAIALVAAGLGVTVVGESVAKRVRSDVVWRRVQGPGATSRSTLAATFRLNDPSPHLQAFLRCLQEAR